MKLMIYGGSLITRKYLLTAPRAVRTVATRQNRDGGKKAGRQERPNFGFLFDIDGVIVRGKNVLPSAPDAFGKLVDGLGKFRVPTVFVTNAGNTMRKNKADQLSSWLGIDVHEDQVVLSHSPLRMFKEYHEKHVLVIGQGPVGDIAKILGFKKVTTMTQLRHAFPTLDAVDHKRRRAAPCGFESYFPRIEAVVLFGEPIRWETSLQLLIDVLVTDGLPALPPESIPLNHLPVLACNMDLQWMAEAPMPRFGHGAFLLCLENLFKKVTGRELVYTALIGKPSEITYRQAEYVLQGEALKLGGRIVRNIYCVGDNVCTDIFGANLYNRYLQSRNGFSQPRKAVRAGAGSGGRGYESHGGAANITRSRRIDHLLGVEEEPVSGAENCYSVLVETGVYSENSKQYVTLDHSPRDFLPVNDSFQEPTYVVRNVNDAVDLIFKEESFTL